METSFIVIFTFLFFQTFAITSSSNVTCIQKERHSLLIFKQSLIDRFNLLSTWRGAECCEWHGVGCDSLNGHVVKLDLRAFGNFGSNSKWLEGELSPSLQRLKHLRYLDLSLNKFSGEIPEFLGSFKRLEYLNLSGPGLCGGVPHHLGNLSRLQYLDLKHTYNYNSKFTGTSSMRVVDDLGWVSSLSLLRYLDLSGMYIGEDTDWFHPINMLPSLLTLNVADCYINIPSIKFVNFTSLSSLDLSLNRINSTIPSWLSNLTGLMHLNLNNNYFHGEIPDSLGMISSLASIDLSLNFFETSMPNLLCNLSSLFRLDLSQNMFFGPIPASLGELFMLEDLYLNDNQLSGDISMSLGQLSKLKNLDLSYNSFTGVLTETNFTKLANLNILILSSNSLALNFSSRWIAPFQLQVFFASFCNVGPNFPNWLQTQTNLQRLHLSNSSIRDTIPKWFENILYHIHDLDLSNNQINGKLPRFHFKNSTQIEDRVLKLNSNKFEGSLATFPSNLNFLDLSDNLLSGHVPLTDATMNPRLKVVNLSKNRFTGSIPVCLCKVLSIKILDLSQNTISGRFPECLGNLIYLMVLDLSNNIITGVVPSYLGSFFSLYSLHLQNNRFEGCIPASLQNLTFLNTMDLGNNFFTGTIPIWIGENLSSLRVLNLGSNKLTDKIPLQLCQLSNLQYLNLAHNNLNGTIPPCFRNLSGMMITTFEDDAKVSYGRFGDIYEVSWYEENILAFMKGLELRYTKTMKFLISLDLSRNNINGEIPDALMYLVGLKNLNLSGNLMTGQIPVIIGDLKQLESLDLSMNKLSGQIPQGLASLYTLSYLNMSFNNLSGPIPVGNQIQTLDDLSIFEGNSGLCGPPVSRSCNVNGVTSDHVGDDEDQNDNARLWFYEGMGPGFVVGFVGLVGSLHFIGSWRVAYFEMLEKVYSWLTILILLNLARLQRKLFE